MWNRYFLGERAEVVVDSSHIRERRQLHSVLYHARKSIIPGWATNELEAHGAEQWRRSARFLGGPR